MGGAARARAAPQEPLHRMLALTVWNVSMPEGGGVEACHCPKPMPKTKKLPAVLAAHKKAPATKTLGERTHGSVRILRKPFLPEDLVTLVRQLVRPKSLI